MQSWRCGCCGKKHSCVLCSECITFFQSGPHRPCGNLGRLICKHLMMKICWESSLFEQIFYGVIHPECYFQVCVFECIVDVQCFFTYVGKDCPFVSGRLC